MITDILENKGKTEHLNLDFYDIHNYPGTFTVLSDILTSKQIKEKY